MEIIAALLFSACSKKLPPGREEQLQQMLTQFFTVRSAGPGTPDGLWLAQKDSVAAVVEKKYLSAYQAKPDEMKKEEIRERLKSLSVLYRIEGRRFAMLTQVADSVGVNVGTLSARPGARKGQIAFDATVRGKDGEVHAQVRYFAQGNAEKLEYIESGYTISATRESRSVEELVRYFTENLKATTILPQY
ncbi:MAG: hypothetical protein OHK0011_22190 [Turneriella sp.]